jgi:hypothetical protein
MSVLAEITPSNDASLNRVNPLDCPRSEYVEIGSGEPIESENLVEFHLLYSGPLHSGGAESARKEKHAIRKVFHPQLQRLWNTDPSLIRLADRYGGLAFSELPEMRSNPNFTLDFNNKPGSEKKQFLTELAFKEIGSQWNRGAFNFVPLVTEEYCLRCSLDILFLRAEEKNFILQGGDIDGRLKALFDALRIVTHTGELPANISPAADENPFFCLLQDDKLISEVRVNTGQLLRLPDAKALNPHDVYLQITVRLNSTQLNQYSWAF